MGAEGSALKATSANLPFALWTRPDRPCVCVRFVEETLQFINLPSRDDADDDVKWKSEAIYSGGSAAG